jgi:predicted SnoaL-like aldol condensation-catalyzing enzyme
MDNEKAIVKRYFEMWNTANIDVADEILAPDYLDHAHPEVKGFDSVKQSLQRVRASDPSFHISIDFMIGEGDLVALRGTIQRTHQGQQVISHVLWFVRVINGKMAELWTGAESPR